MTKNKIYDDEFFNPIQKERYLKDQSEPTKRAYTRILQRASKIENKLGKDLYDFNLNEIGQLLYILKATKLSTVMHSGNIVQNYIRWAIAQDLRIDNINPLDAVASGEFYKQFLDTSEPTLFHIDRIMKIVKECINYQDKLTIQGLLEGIYGRQYSELLTLKMDRIKEVTENPPSYEATLVNETIDGNELRTIPISNELYTIMRIANEEEFNYKNNGLDFAGMRSNKDYLTKTDYIVRAAENSRTSASRDTVAAPALVNRRLKKIAELFQIPTLTATNIRNSGMLYMAYCLLKENNKLEKEEYMIICERYNVGRTKEGDYVYSRLKSDFLNVDMIEQIYGGE